MRSVLTSLSPRDHTGAAFLPSIMSELFISGVALALRVMLSFLVDALTYLLKLCFLMTGRTLHHVLLEEELGALASEFYKYNNDESKKVSILSPEKMSYASLAVPLPDAWRPVHAIDGISSGVLRNVSFRWQYEDCSLQHMQGLIQLQRYGTSKLHRIQYDGYHSIHDDNGYACKGNRAYGTVYFPVDSRPVITAKLFKSQKRGTKHCGIRAVFGTNDDRLAFVQLLVIIGDDDANMSATLAFQEQLGRALVGGYSIDDEDGHLEVGACHRQWLHHGRCQDATKIPPNLPPI